MDGSDQAPTTVLRRLLAAMNAHDVEAMVSCFAEDYVNETPIHPLRGFRGNEQVRTNYTQIFANVPDLHARVPRSAVDGDTLWTEWDIRGTRRDGAAFLMRGVAILDIEGNAIASARFYLDSVEEGSGDVDTHVRRVAGIITPGAGPAAGVPS
jgi:ketosteroid isomerase-like protein